MMSGEQRLAAAVSEYLLSEGMLSQAYRPGPFYESPIERLFFLAITLACEMHTSWFELTPAKPSDNTGLRIQAQYNLLDWPIDYVFSVLSSEGGRVSQLAVECDGHEFHERTKEQAARDRLRDRRLQDKGITVYRFTGSEIYRDALGTARQVLKWAEKHAWLELHEGK